MVRRRHCEARVFKYLPAMPNTYFISQRDLDFLLFEQLGIQTLANSEKFGDFGQEDYSMIIGEAIDVMPKRVEPSRRQHAHLAHAPSKHLAIAPSSDDEVLVAHQHGSHRGAEALGQAQ